MHKRSSLPSLEEEIHLAAHLEEADLECISVEAPEAVESKQIHLHRCLEWEVCLEAWAEALEVCQEVWVAASVVCLEVWAEALVACLNDKSNDLTPSPKALLYH